jgi:hypothetical protein
MLMSFHGNDLPLWLLSCRRLLDAAGHLDHMHVGSFQHGYMSLCILLAGLLGLLCLAFPLPSGTEHACHVVGFLTESLVFWYHIKPSPLDHVVRVMAGYCWLGLAATSALQCVQPRAFLLACARTLLMLLQGAWSIQNAYIMFSGGTVRVVGPAQQLHYSCKICVFAAAVA